MLTESATYCGAANAGRAATRAVLGRKPAARSDEMRLDRRGPAIAKIETQAVAAPAVAAKHIILILPRPCRSGAPRRRPGPPLARASGLKRRRTTVSAPRGRRRSETIRLPSTTLSPSRSSAGGSSAIGRGGGPALARRPGHLHALLGAAERCRTPRAAAAVVHRPSSAHRRRPTSPGHIRCRSPACGRANRPERAPPAASRAARRRASAVASAAGGQSGSPAASARSAREAGSAPATGANSQAASKSSNTSVRSSRGVQVRNSSSQASQGADALRAARGARSSAHAGHGEQRRGRKIDGGARREPGRSARRASRKTSQKPSRSRSRASGRASRQERSRPPAIAVT